MKKGILRVIVYVLTFVISVILISRYMNKGNTDMTTEMSEAQFPVLSFVLGGEEINQVYGYADAMECSFQRETVTPVLLDRQVSIRLQKFDAEIEEISYQVRSVDGQRLIEDNKLTEYRESKEQIDATITLKDLIEAEKEYCLVVIATLESGQDVYFYTRIIQSDKNYAEEKIAFVKDFHEKTFNKEEAKELTKYLESDATGDNTTLAKVNIHSSFQQITWADLGIFRETAPTVTVLELEQQTGSFKLEYIAAVHDGRTKKQYRVIEKYRIRYTTERVYLLDYERSMEQFFDENASNYVNNKIDLGIQNTDVQLVENDGGVSIAFVVNGKLYGYNAADKKLAVLFSFYDEKNWDVRTLNDQHDIKVLSVEEGGNVQFMVYGYMNRGRYEGRVGIQIYRYDAALNMIEELLYIPCNTTYQILKAEIERLSFVSKNNDFFFIFEEAVYMVNLETKKAELLVEGLAEGSYKVSATNKMFVWSKENEQSGNSLILMNLTTMERKEISSIKGEKIIPLGFMQEDLIYGLAREEDAESDVAGNKEHRIYKLNIQDENHHILKTYRQEGIFITDCQIQENQILLKRVEKDEETGVYREISDDQIMSAIETVDSINRIEPAVTEKYETIMQVALKDEIDAKSVKILTPREVLYEGGRELNFMEESSESRYYVYALGDVKGIYGNSAAAVGKAYENAGVVIDKSGNYVWKKGLQHTRNQIMAITGTASDENRSDIEVCMDVMLEFAGVPKRTHYTPGQKKSVYEILEDNLGDGRVLDLTGVPLAAVLYYADKDIPVLAMLEDGSAVLVIGFNELNIVVMNPQTGTTYKKGMNDSKELFEENGNCFLAYMEETE